MAKRRYRSRTDRKIWRVCGCLVKYFDIDPTIVRIITMVSIFFGTLGIWTYVIMAPYFGLQEDRAPSSS